MAEVSEGKVRETMKLPMRTLAVIALGLMLGTVLTFVVEAQAGSTKHEVALTGIVSDSMCGRQHMMSGNDAECVRSCVKSGAQYALIVDDKIYRISGKTDELGKLAGQKATLSGNIVGSDLQVSSVAAVQPPPPVSTDSDPPPPSTTIEGLVRDIACPIQNKAATATKFNLKCAQECARLGSPLIVLTQDGTLYTPISESMPDQDQRKRLLPFLGRYVRVTGPVFERNGTHAIAIRTIEELTGVQVQTDAE